MVKVKICGITSIDDALGACDAGADALGFVFYEKSPRWIAPESAASIVSELPPFVARVGVFVDSPLETVRQIMSFCHLNVAQLHGEESPEYCNYLLPGVVKAFRVRDGKLPERVEVYSVPTYLLDAYNPGLPGGTGETFDWGIAMEFALARRVILAGGLTPSNVGRAVAAVKPYGVDVSSGVESSPGKKDAVLVRAFIKSVKGVDNEE